MIPLNRFFIPQSVQYFLGVISRLQMGSVWRSVGEGEKTYKFLVSNLIFIFRRFLVGPIMQSLLINSIDCLAISLFLYLLFVLRDHRRRGGLPYPPGPPPRPIIGNILDIPKDAPWIAYVDMSRKYGTHNIIGDFCSHPAEADTRASRRCHLSSRLFRGRHRVEFVICPQRSPREAWANLLREATLANRRNVRIVAFSYAKWPC